MPLVVLGKRVLKTKRWHPVAGDPSKKAGQGMDGQTDCARWGNFRGKDHLSRVGKTLMAHV